MLEDQLRETFAAKAGSIPSRSLTSLDRVADAAIRGAARSRRRRRATVAQLTGIAAFAATSIAILHTLSAGAPSAPHQPSGPVAQASPLQRPSAAGTPTAPIAPLGMREVTGIGPSAEVVTRVRLQLPANSTVTAAYQAKDGYLMVNTQPDGNKQLVLQDDSEHQQVLVDKATSIRVAKDGSTVAWASEGRMNVSTRSEQDARKIARSNSVDVPQNTEPVTFVGTNLVIHNDEMGFDVWRTDQGYSEAWDSSVVRVFGGTLDSGGVYAELTPVAPGTAMCLALIEFKQPLKISDKVCGLPVAAQAGARISPDGRWLAYPVVGARQVAILDLTTVFSNGKAKLWELSVTAKTVWINPTTFVVDNGEQFLTLDPTGKADQVEPLDQQSDGAVLIEPLAQE